MLALKKSTHNDQAIGRSKGGLSTKIHTVCDGLGNPTAFHLTPGQHHDLAGADALMGIMTKAETVLADKAYDDLQFKEAIVVNKSTVSESPLPNYKLHKPHARSMQGGNQGPHR